MNLFVTNLAIFSAQLLALVVMAACAYRLFALRHPLATAQFWHLVLVSAVALPLVQPRLSAGEGDVMAGLVPGSLSRATAGSTGLPELVTVLWYVWLAGAAWHVGLLIAGLVRLRGLKRGAGDVGALGALVSRLNARLGTDADVLLSDAVPGPVTFGLLRGTVLLPRSSRGLARETIEAVLCHELLHIKRRDWLWTLAEAAWASVLWFHPAARYLSSRSSLARELVVDAQTLAVTQDQRAYAQALLEFAVSSTGPATVATPFFTRRHLPDRVAFIVNQEAPMDPRRRLVRTGTALTLVAVAVTLVIREVPMLSAPQHAEPVPEQRVALSGEAGTQAPRPGNGITPPSVVYQEKPQYTPEALVARIQGNVMLDVVVLEDGTVGEVTVTKSLDSVHGLDEAAVSTVKRWRFKPGTSDGNPVAVTVTIEMTFTLKD